MIKHVSHNISNEEIMRLRAQGYILVFEQAPKGSNGSKSHIKAESEPSLFKLLSKLSDARKAS